MQLFPAIQGTVGTWRYYSTKMTAGDLAGQVKFASEVWESKALDVWIQRALNESRAKNDIASYLAKHEDRFFSSIVVAAIEGNPKFFSVQIADDPQFAILSDDRMNESFGVLRFDGTQKYYALDGQHRLKAIKALLDQETEVVMPDGFENEEFSVIIVVQREDESREHFMQKYRRLFSHLNRYAKPMDKATTIIMEEDDAIAICTRRLIQEHPFFSWIDEESRSTRVRCERSENMSVAEPYFTNIITLYKMTTDLLYSNARKNSEEWGEITGAKQKLSAFIRMRPDDEALDSLYSELSLYWDAILQEFPCLRTEPRIMRGDRAEDIDDDGVTLTNHVLFRPVGQQLFSTLIRQLLDYRLADPESPTHDTVSKAIKDISRAEWRLHQAPWRHLLFVYDAEKDKWRMRNEDRNEAVRVGLIVMLWIVNAVSYTSEATVESNVKTPWRNLLVNVTEDEIDQMWDQIEQQAELFRV